jgi:hypothetical protein
LAFRSSAKEQYLVLDEPAETLAAPFHRLDALDYVDIARDGYELAHPGLFPLYPLLVRAAGEVTSSLIVGGILVSLACLVVGLVLLHRLAVLEMGEAAARRTVYLVALFPTTVYLTAVYTESLFLVLSVGCLLAARTGHWGVAGVLGMLGSATRNTGWMLVVVLLFLYLYGPRADRSPDSAQAGWRPRYRLRRDALWLGLVPLGLVAYSIYCAAEFGDGLAWVDAHAESANRSVQAPLSGFRRGLFDGVAGLAGLVGGGGSRGQYASDVVSAGVLIFAVIALVGAFLRLPTVYGLYAALSMSVTLTAIDPDHPLTGFARYILPLFPLQMWVALWAHTRRRFAFALAVGFAGVVGATAAFSLGRLA